MTFRKSISDTAMFLRLGWRRAATMLDKHGPSAQLERALGRICARPKRRDKAGASAYLLVAGLGGVVILCAARFAGVIPDSTLLMTLAGSTSFTLTNPFFVELHGQVPNTMAVLSFLAPATLFTVNLHDLYKIGKLPESATKIIIYSVGVFRNLIVGISRAVSAMKALKPLKSILPKVRFWRRRGAAA